MTWCEDLQSNSASSLNVGGSFCVSPGVLHGLGGAARFQQLTSGHVHFFLSVLPNDGVEFSRSKQACTTGLCLETQSSRASPLCSPAGLLTGLLGAPDCTGLGLDIQTVAPDEAQNSSRFCCSGERLSGHPLQRSPPSGVRLVLPGFTLSHLGPHDAVAFTQRVLLD